METDNSKHFPKYISTQLVLTSTNDQSPRPQALSPTISTKNIRCSIDILDGIILFKVYIYTSHK